MKSIASILAAAALIGVPAAAGPASALDKECGRVIEVYPLLMLTVMAEGPMDCSLSHDDSDPVPCDINDTEEEKAARARRLAIRTYQEAAYRKADAACAAWLADRSSPSLIEVVTAAIAEARATDSGVLPQRQ